MSTEVLGTQSAHVWQCVHTITYLVAVDRSVTTMGGVSIVFCTTAVLHCMSLAALQSDTNKPTFIFTEEKEVEVLLHDLCVPGHSLYLQPLFYAVGQGLLVVVFADASQDSLLVGFILVTAGINLAWNGIFSVDPVGCGKIRAPWTFVWWLTNQSIKIRVWTQRPLGHQLLATGGTLFITEMTFSSSLNKILVSLKQYGIIFLIYSNSS